MGRRVRLKIEPLHSWDVSPAEAIEIQNRLRSLVRVERLASEVHLVAGVDISLKERGRAVVVVLTFPELELTETTVFESPVEFPYIPGLLSFREAPLILGAMAKLEHAPDLILVDGQGYAHPRRFGIASHLGVLLDRPTVGCAKSILVGRGPEPELEAGAWTELLDRGEVVGAAVRTRSGVKPVYVSVGHKIDLPTAIHYVLACTRGYRLPEPTRLAHQLAGEG
jgi:deoxyribonuclease V